MNKTKKLYEEFESNFVIHNGSSNSGLWWIVPFDRYSKEIASPTEVWRWIQSNFTTKTEGEK